MEKNNKKYKNNKEVYEVEAILDTKIENGTKKFLVKWKNYPESTNSWEKESNCHCPKMVAEYEKHMKQQSKRKINESNESDAKPTKRFKKSVSLYCKFRQILINLADISGIHQHTQTYIKLTIVSFLL